MANSSPFSLCQMLKDTHQFMSDILYQYSTRFNLFNCMACLDSNAKFTPTNHRNLHCTCKLMYHDSINIRSIIQKINSKQNLKNYLTSSQKPRFEYTTYFIKNVDTILDIVY